MAYPELDVWMNGLCVARWSWLRTGTPVLRYTHEWRQSPLARPLSLSLPLPAGDSELKGQVVADWFDNLLPDNERIRKRLARRFRTPGTATAELLAALGRDCVGAVQLVPAGHTPGPVDTLDSQVLDDGEVERQLADVTRTEPVDDDREDLRISIAGAQEKTALLWRQGHWHRPLGTTPTTHIFKLPMGLVGNMRADMSASIENEWLCGRILTALGFTVAPSQMRQFGRQRALVVERFDRRSMDGGRWIARLPQEDFCQALGVPWQRKYESDGGPGIPAALALLSGSEDPQGDKLRFVMAQLAFWLLAATDGHAKNFSVFIEPGGRYRLTPLYDVLSVWPLIGNADDQLPLRRARLAMALRGRSAHYHLQEIQARHWQALAQQSGVHGAFELMRELARRVPMALEQVQAQLPEGFPSKVWNPIRRGLIAQAGRFLKAGD